jgi:crotonobetainyl-CoA:carnitine CoA-transferase CaiB-like acyl-CoA transferase
VTPLDDIFVLDLSRILSGPFCTKMIGDMGATIVKVEPPPRGDDTRLWGPPFINGISTYFLSINRNKRSIGLNLKSPQGQEVLWKLVDRADVLVENFRPGVLDKLGFGFDAVSARNPRLIYASISGYGQTGPYRNRPGYDVVAQGESGVVDLTGEPDRQPVKVGASIADIVAGLYAYQGILLAMLARHRTGKGQRVDIALLDGMISTLTYQAASYFATGKSPKRLGTRHPSIVPYETFETRDGFVNIGAANEKQWQNLCRALDVTDLAFDTRFNTMAGRISNYGELRAILDARLRKLSRAEAFELLARYELPVGPINTVAEVLEDPHIHAREMVKELTHPEYGPLRYLGIPVKLSDTPGELQGPPPRFGEHNRNVLAELGYDDHGIDQLAMSNVIAEAEPALGTAGPAKAGPHR